MNARRPWGIALSASLPLMLFAFSFVLLAGGLLFAFHDLTRTIDRSANRNLPALTDTATLVRQCEWVRGMSFRLMQSDNELVLNARLAALRERIRALTETLRSIEATGLYPGELQRLKGLMADFAGSAETLDLQVALTLRIRRQRGHCVKAVRALSGELDGLLRRAPHSAALEEWSRPVSLSFTLLLVLGRDTDMPYGLRVSGEVYAQLREARAALERLLASEDERLRPFLANVRLLHEQLIAASLDENGILPLFRRAYEADRELTDLGGRIDRLSDAVVDTAADLFRQARAESALFRDGFHRRSSVLSAWLIVLTVFSLVAIVCTHLYLSRAVIRPVIRLNQCMRLRTRKVKTPLPRGGAGEVREMARSVAFFINQLEDREERLRRSHDDLEKQVCARTEELDRLSKRLLQTQEEERFRLAAELHDDIGATMSVIKFGIERALIILRGEGTGGAREPLKEAVGLVKGLMRQLRRIQYELRPAHIDLGLLNSLRWFCDDWQAAHPDVRLRLRTRFEEAALPAALRIVLFRLIQESLNNVAKHSGARTAGVVVADARQGLLVTVADDGKGFDPQTPLAEPGLGLQSMRERVEFSGGVFRLRSEPGRGVVVKAIWTATALRFYAKS